jgi:2-polyprenyl-3-methyl-5-hydroxy-6-metoxy-1,4-benzoquinol methylase
MTAEDHTTPLARAVELLQRGPESAAAPPRRRLRRSVRSGLLRAIRPYSHYQRDLDAEVVGALERQRAELDHVRLRHSEQIERLEQFVRELILTAESLRRATSDAAMGGARSAASAHRAIERVERTVDAVTAELRAVPYMAGHPFESFESAVGDVLGFRSRVSVGNGISDYVDFEELFRGPAERVAESQRPYIDLVRGHEPVLDVGCGRGEFLKLLADEGIAATGVDSDAGMIERCRELGVEVALDDANEHLEGLADHTLGTIFSAQVVEHLPYPELRRMLDLATRKLRPGGLLIAETVNPHRVASLKTFWVDLTHQHPIFPEVALTMCATAGFESAFVFAPTFDGFERARFKSPAYAVVASVPEAGVTRA